MSEQKQITVSEVLNDLENGLSRKEIAEKYEISAAEVTWMFKQPGLIGKRAKKKFVPSFQLVNDINEADTVEVISESDGNTTSEFDGGTASESPIPTVTEEEQKEVAGVTFSDFE